MVSSQSTIKIYGRVRPLKKNSKKVSGKYWVDPSDTNGSKVGFHIPKDLQTGLINNQRETFEFKFDRVFDQQTQQEEVFDVVAKPVVQSALDGYNGTIFAYGQVNLAHLDRFR